MAEYQSFGIDRDAFFDAEHHRSHILGHVCPPRLGDQPLDVQDLLVSPRVLDNVVTRFGVPEASIKHTTRRVFRRLERPLPGPVQDRTIPGEELIFWAIEWLSNGPGDGDLTSQGAAIFYPSTLIRTVQGDIIHVEINNSHGPHTIHWHGIEPSTMHDGVGKHSLEISGGNYIYQFQTNHPGTFFYHCHKNTVLHFEMGMFGGFIVDPPPPPDSGLTAPYWGGQGYVAGRLTNSPSGTRLIRYDVERIWVSDEIDSRWHNGRGSDEPDHDKNLQDCNDPVGIVAMNEDTFYRFDDTSDDLRDFNLNEFNPDVFAVSGQFLNYGETGPGGTAIPSTYYDGILDNPLLNISALRGQKVLIRFLNAGYTIQEVSLPIPGTIIAWDGSPLGLGGIHRYSRPYVVPANTPIRTTSARRFDMIIDTSQMTAPFSGFGKIEYYHWIKGKPQGKIAEIRIPVNIT